MGSTDRPKIRAEGRRPPSPPACRRVLAGIVPAYAVARAQPSCLTTRTADAGYFTSFSAGRMGRTTRFPPQFGQCPPNVVSVQSRQKVHSKLQIMASAAFGGRSLLQHSQFGLSSSILVLLMGRRFAEWSRRG